MPKIYKEIPIVVGSEVLVAEKEAPECKKVVVSVVSPNGAAFMGQDGMWYRTSWVEDVMD